MRLLASSLNLENCIGVTKKQMGNYLFIVYDCNDESRMKVVKRYKEGVTSLKDLESLCNTLLAEQKNETAWLEIYKLTGRRTAQGKIK